MAITASMVAELRAKTDAPMMECKKALTEADGDMDKAEELLRVKLGNKAGKAASRITAEGVVAASIDGSTGALLEVNCETDFVTKNDSFMALANAAAALVAKNNPADVAALVALPYSQDGFGPTLEDVRKGLIGKIGENMSFRRFKRFERRQQAGEPTCTARASAWSSSTRATTRRQGRRDARRRHEARRADQRRRAGRPDREGARGGHRQGRRGPQGAEAAGKPAQSEEIVAKRIEGGVQKYLKEVSLFNQPFVKNDKQTVEQMLKAANTTGEGIHPVRRRRGHREEGRRLRRRSGRPGRRRQAGA
jgi:elongation factor Ts